MPIDTGSRRPRRQTIGPTHTSTHAPVSAPARAYQRTIPTTRSVGPESSTSRNARGVARRQGPLHLVRNDANALPLRIQSPLVWAILESRRQNAIARARQSVANIIASAPSYLSDTNPKVNLNSSLAGHRNAFAGTPFQIAGVTPWRNPSERSLIKLSQGISADLSRKPQSEAYQAGKHVLNHELVHTNQPQSRRGSPLPLWLREGGAELLSRKVSRQEGDTYKFDPVYQAFVRRVKRAGGVPLVRRSLRP